MQLSEACNATLCVAPAPYIMYLGRFWAAQCPYTASDHSNTSHLCTLQEDDLLRAAVKKYGDRAWATVANDVPGRSSKSCSDRCEPLSSCGGTLPCEGQLTVPLDLVASRAAVLLQRQRNQHFYYQPISCWAKTTLQLDGYHPSGRSDKQAA